MSALIWNVRGLNIKARRRDVTEHIARIKLRKLHRFQRCIPADWLYRTNHNHSEGESFLGSSGMVSKLHCKFWSTDYFLST